MQKAELINLHALLAKTHDYLADRHDFPETFEEYDADDFGPYQIQRQKDEHEAAVVLLAERLADEVRGERSDETVAESRDNRRDESRDEPAEVELQEA